MVTSTSAADDENVALFRRGAAAGGGGGDDDDDFTDDDGEEEFEGDSEEEERQLRVLDDEDDEDDDDEEGLVEDGELVVVLKGGVVEREEKKKERKGVENCCCAGGWDGRRLSLSRPPPPLSPPLTYFLYSFPQPPSPASDEEEYDDEEEEDGGEELAGLERGARGGVGLSPEQRQQLQQLQQLQQQQAQAQAAGAGAPSSSRSPAPLAPKEWAGISGMPEPTRDRIEDALDRFAQVAAAAGGETASRKTLTVLVLGTPGSGKSATTNSLLNERVAQVSPLQSESGRPVLAARRPPAGSPQVTVAIIDTPSLVASPEFGDDDAGGGVSCAAANALGNALSGRPIDAVLFVDRLDGFPIGKFESALAKAYTAAFGAGLWDKATLVLTHGRLTCPPGGASLDDFAASRAAELRAALRKAGASSSTAQLPALLAENGSRCPKNAAEEPILLDGEPWLPAVWEAIVDSSLSSNDAPSGHGVSPFVPDSAKARKAADPNRKKIWLVPLLLAAQLALRWLVVERVIAADGCKGDKEGPFSDAVAKLNLRMMREERKGGKGKGSSGSGKGGSGKKSGGGGDAAAAALQRRKRAAAAAAAAKRKRASAS